MARANRSIRLISGSPKGNTVARVPFRRWRTSLPGVRSAPPAPRTGKKPPRIAEAGTARVDKHCGHCAKLIHAGSPQVRARYPKGPTVVVHVTCSRPRQPDTQSSRTAPGSIPKKDSQSKRPSSGRRVKTSAPEPQLRPLDRLKGSEVPPSIDDFRTAFANEPFSVDDAVVRLRVTAKTARSAIDQEFQRGALLYAGQRDDTRLWRCAPLPGHT